MRDNLHMENNGSGVIVADNRYDYTPINDKQTPLPQGQLNYIKNEIYDYWGSNENIIQNKATPAQENDFFIGEIKPFITQLEQAFTKCLFRHSPYSVNDEIIVEADKFQFAQISDTLNGAKFLAEMGALSIDQACTLFGLRPIGGEEGKRRLQTLNYVNAVKADKYQVGEDGEGAKNE